jgi:RHS repeat-associated protein
MARLIVEANTNDDRPTLLGDKAQNSVSRNQSKVTISPQVNWANAALAANESNPTDRADEDDEPDSAETLDIEQFAIDPRRLMNMSAKERSFVLRGMSAKLKRHGQAIAKENKQQQGLAPLSKEQTTHRIEYYQVDHLGTPQELTSAQGEVIWQATYAAWGNTVRIITSHDGSGQGVALSEGNRQRLTPHTDIAEQRFKKQTRQEAANEASFGPRDDQQQNLRFQGQYFDQETGLHYNRFRYYDPDVGRFTNQDPIAYVGGANFFRYAPNPVTFVDPFGLDYKTNWMRAAGRTTIPADHQIHHMIPQKLAAEAKRLCPTFDVDDANNLIALPTGPSVPTQSGHWYGSTIHLGKHPGYQQAVDKALTVARRLNIPGLCGCAKVAALQNMLRNQLQSGGIDLNKGPGTATIRTNWLDYLRNSTRGP